MEKDKVDKVKQEPHLSGAYIRSLVKHLTSTKPKDPVDGGIVNTNDENNHHNTKQESPPQPPQPSPPPPPPQIKKQVRRRQHTTRPYQERLLNMAEARREIVTALKFHRASMKQQEAATFTAATTTAAAASPPSVPHYWGVCVPTIAPPPLPPQYQENLNFPLPNQTLGLNLNFQDFKNLDANLYHNPLSVSSTSSSSSSSAAISGGETAVGMPEEVVAGGLHHAMDDDEIEEIKSLGEQHQMEWNDTMNLVMSAKWFKFLKTMEDTQKDDFYGFNPFDQVMEFPPWLINANEQHFHDHFCDDYLQDPDLSW